MGVRRMQLLGAIWVVVAVTFSAFSHETDAHEHCRPGFATCHKGRSCKTRVSCDPQNCGKCGVKCPNAAHGQGKCENGRCTLECQWRHGWRDCDSKKGNGCETNVDTNPNHCGTCGKVCPVPLSNGIATCSKKDGCGIQCDAPFSKCGTECLNLQTDTANCGTCGNACSAPANGNSTCSGGTCSVTCNDGFMLCGGECRNVDNDASNCGTCNNSCSAPANGNAACLSGTCSVSCQDNLKLCDGKCVDLDNDASNCGTCNNACSAPANGNAACLSGTCCQDGLKLCDGKCVDLDNDASNCGTCNRACYLPDNGSAECSRGECGVN